MTKIFIFWEKGKRVLTLKSFLKRLSSTCEMSLHFIFLLFLKFFILLDFVLVAPMCQGSVILSFSDLAGTNLATARKKIINKNNKKIALNKNPTRKIKPDMRKEIGFVIESSFQLYSFPERSLFFWKNSDQENYIIDCDGDYYYYYCCYQKRFVFRKQLWRVGR